MCISVNEKNFLDFYNDRTFNANCFNADGSNVTFSYIDHKDNKYNEITISAEKFIMILLRHLLPSQYKIIRYYGFYRKKHPLHNKMIPLIKPFLREFRKSLIRYRESILLYFNRDPYFCPHCNIMMKFVDLLN